MIITRISDAIRQLEAIKAEHGDLLLFECGSEHGVSISNYHFEVEPLDCSYLESPEWDTQYLAEKHGVMFRWNGELD